MCRAADESEANPHPSRAQRTGTNVARKPRRMGVTSYHRRRCQPCHGGCGSTGGRWMPASDEHLTRRLPSRHYLRSARAKISRRLCGSDFPAPPNIKLSGASFLPPPLPNSDYCVLSKRRCAPCPKVSAIKSANATSVRRNAGTGLKLPHRHRYETITSRWSAVGCRWPVAMNSRSS